MKNQKILKGALSMMITSIFITGCSFNAEQSERPNIVLILSDDHSVPYLGCYGNTDLKTPNIDRIASQGIRFDEAYTTAPQCVPSRASIMTGRPVVDVRMTRFSAPLPADIITFPEKLREAGYFTGLCGRSYHLDGSAIQPEETKEVFEKFGLRTFANRVDFLRKSNGQMAYAEFKEFLDQVPAEKPFFIQVGYNDPHRPFNAPEFNPNPSNLTIPPGMPDTPELRKDLAAHYGLIHRLDKNVGEILNELDKRELDQNTLVIFMGDNGAALLRGKGTLYKCGLHVPLIARWPAIIKPGQISDAFISGEDIAPTLIEIAGVSLPEKVSGISFLPVFHGKNYEDHEYIFAARGTHGSGLPDGTASFDLSRTVFSKKHKLIYNALWQIPYDPVDFYDEPVWKELTLMNEQNKLEKKYSDLFFAPVRPMFELFDLEKDPNEFINVIGFSEYTEVEKLLKYRLQEWMILNQDYLPLPIPTN